MTRVRSTPRTHRPFSAVLTAQGPERTYVKGAAYLSPLVWGSCPEGDERKRLLGQFREVKVESRLPVYLYLIQRL